MVATQAGDAKRSFAESLRSIDKGNGESSILKRVTKSRELQKTN